MDIFLQTLLLIVITLIVSIIVIHQRNLGSTKTLPPGSLGWPLVGETYQILFNMFEDLFQGKHKKHSSEIFKTKVAGEPTVVLCGPIANKFLSTSESKLVKVWYPKSQRGLFHLPDHDNETHAIVPKRVPVKNLGFLKPEGIVRYMGSKKIESVIDQHFMTHWEGKTELKVYPLVHTFTLTLAYKFYLGIDEPHHVEELSRKFDSLHHGNYAVPVNFPGTTYHKAMKAASAIREEIQFLINEKVDALSKGNVVMDDLLSHIVGAEKDGKYVPKIEISNVIMGLMSSSYILTATVLAFMIKHIGLNPDIYQKILSEHADITKSKGGGAAAVDWDSIQKMKYTWAVAQETIRLYSPVPGAFREAVTDITYHGFTIPKGWKIFWAVIGTNKDPKYFDEPESFDPSRFEGNNNGPAPYTYIPFGAGPRSCPGKDYARFVILTFIHKLITKFKWQVMDPHEKVFSGALVPIPANGIPIRIHHL